MQYTSNAANTSSIKTSPNLEKLMHRIPDDRKQRQSILEQQRIPGQNYLSLHNEGSNISQLYTPSSQGGGPHTKVLMHKKLTGQVLSANSRVNKFAEPNERQYARLPGGAHGGSKYHMYHNLYPHTQPHSLNRRDNLINQNHDKRSPYQDKNGRIGVHGTTSSTDNNSLNGLRLTAQNKRCTNQTYNNEPLSIVDSSEQQQLQIRILARKL